MVHSDLISMSLCYQVSVKEIFLNALLLNHRIMGYPDLEGTHENN